MAKEQTAATLAPGQMVMGSAIVAEDTRTTIKQANWTFGNRPQVHINQTTGKRVGSLSIPSSAQTHPSTLGIEFRPIGSGSVEVLRFFINVLPETVTVTAGIECYLTAGSTSTEVTIGSLTTAITHEVSPVDESLTEKTASFATSTIGTGWLLCTVAIERTLGVSQATLNRVRIQDEPITSGLPSPIIEGDNNTMDIQEEGSAVVLSARKLNFIGADVTAVSAGAGTANVTVTGGGGTALPVADTTEIAKGATDATKKIRLECDTNITTGNTRVITIADQDIDMTPGTGSYAAAGAADSTLTLETKTADATLTGKNKIVMADVSSGSASITLTLPAAATAGSGAWIGVKDKAGQAGTHAVNVAPASGEEIDNSTASLSIISDNGALTVFSDGSAWYVRG